jgi:RNA polymerase sigma factor (sigma-70 family)
LELDAGCRTLLGMRDAEEPASDEALWLRVRAGEAAEVGTIFDRHNARVLRHCRRWTQSNADAEDLTSMVFLEALRRADAVRFVDGSALPWLLVVATNLARNQARARRRYRALLSRLPAPETVGDVAEEVIATVDNHDQALRLTAALGTLRRSEQDVVALCDLAGLSYVQAADALGIPVGTVRSRLSRARAKLRRALGDEPSMHPVAGPEVAR